MHMLGSTCSPCCSAPCDLGSCTVTFNFLDENQCEDDAFDFFLENPTTGSTRFIQNVDLKSTPSGKCGDPSASYANITIPVTVTATDFDVNCEVFVVLTKTSSNCCSTYTRFRVIRPDGSILLGTYFGPAGLRVKYTWSDLCEPGPPPTPPRSCCKIEVKCDDADGNPATVGSCTALEPECCADSGYSQQDCGTTPIPGVTLCDNGYETRDEPPYDCAVGTDFSSLQISFYNLDLTEITDEGSDYATLKTAVQAEVNGTWVFSSVCLSTVKEAFPTISFIWTDPYGTDWDVDVNVEAETSICNRYVILYIGVSGPINITITREKNAITPTKYSSRCPINGVKELCACSNFSGSWDVPSGTGGTVDVRPTV